MSSLWNYITIKIIILSIVFHFTVSLSHSSSTFQNKSIMKRPEFLTVAFSLISCANASWTGSSAFAFTARNSNMVSYEQTDSGLPVIGYQDIYLDMKEAKVPVACWFPVLDEKDEKDAIQSTSYSHRISVRKIGSMLAGMNFIPEFVSKDFELKPTTVNGNVVRRNMQSLNGLSGRSVIILAHGFLGSRFDLAHIAEELALDGYVVFSPEFPESLANSYDKVDGLDRSIINDRLLEFITSNMNVQRFGVIGHSLGCGTALNIGDDSWTRICIAGPSVRRDGVQIKGNQFAIVSTNDGLVKSLDRVNQMIPREFVRLQENELESATFASKSALIFDRQDGPNHISFLAGNANDCMVDFLSPLLPVAQALQIPVLDFDKYQKSRDSQAVAKIVVPAIRSYLKQYM
jgi:pimeloyl-ACP methyl ester carboxylesterase